MTPRTEFQDVMNKDPFTVTASIYGTAASSSSNYGVFYTAQFPCEIMAISESHGTAGSDGSAVGLQIEKLPSGSAIGTGTLLLANAIDLKGTANTPIYPAFGTVVTDRQLLRTDRLALLQTGTPTAVAGVNVTLLIKPLSKGHYAMVGSAYIN